MASNPALARRRRQAKAEPKGASGLLEVGEADRRLDALIEEEQRARSLDPGPKIIVHTALGRSERRSGLVAATASFGR